MSRLTDATAELYSADPDAFVSRRKELAAAARSAGDAAAAKAIAALGKPTRSAWLINRLVRADPAVAERITELGGQLRAGEAALDGAGIRKLSVARRDLVDTLVRQAVADQPPPSAAVREEVTGTFNAALADPEIASQVASGTVLKAAQWAGFGLGIGTAVPAAGFAPASAAPPAPASLRAQARRGKEDAAERQREASQAAEAATAAQRVQQQAVRTLEKQLSDDKQGAADAERDLAGARQRLAEAQRALTEAQHRHETASERLSTTRKTLAQARKELDAAAGQVRQTAAAHRKAARALNRLPS